MCDCFFLFCKCFLVYRASLLKACALFSGWVLMLVARFFACNHVHVTEHLVSKCRVVWFINCINYDRSSNSWLTDETTHLPSLPMCECDGPDERWIPQSLLHFGPLGSPSASAALCIGFLVTILTCTHMCSYIVASVYLC